MPEDEQQHQPIKVERFPEYRGVRALTVGNLLLMNHANLGKTFFLDVTDMQDPSQVDTEFPTLRTGWVRDLMEEELTGATQDAWDVHNNIVVLVTNRYASEKRVYLGLSKVKDDDPKARNVTTTITTLAGFKQSEMYVPMSSDSDKAREVILEGLANTIDAYAQSPNPDQETLQDIVRRN